MKMNLITYLNLALNSVDPSNALSSNHIQPPYQCYNCLVLGLMSGPTCHQRFSILNLWVPLAGTLTVFSQVPVPLRALHHHRHRLHRSAVSSVKYWVVCLFIYLFFYWRTLINPRDHYVILHLTLSLPFCNAYSSSWSFRRTRVTIACVAYSKQSVSLSLVARNYIVILNTKFPRYNNNFYGDLFIF